MKRPAKDDMLPNAVSPQKCSECGAVARSLLPRQWTTDLCTYTCCECYTGGVASDEDEMWSGMKAIGSVITVNTHSVNNEPRQSSQPD